jgi:hypothetical protein
MDRVDFFVIRAGWRRPADSCSGEGATPEAGRPANLWATPHRALHRTHDAQPVARQVQLLRIATDGRRHQTRSETVRSRTSPISSEIEPKQVPL